MRKAVPVLCFLLVVLTFANRVTAVSTLSYTENFETALSAGAIVVDVRQEKSCLEGSLFTARCLPASDFFGPHGRLVNMADLLWLLGTAGLSGKEHVLIAGNSPLKRDFVAGILFLAGQQKVSILTVSFPELKNITTELTSGQKRQNTRQVVHNLPFRSDLIILRNELSGLFKEENLPDLLDGRSENEYWGENIRTFRGGHLPGAQHLPPSRLRSLLENDSEEILNFGSPIVYAHNTIESVAYFSLLRAGFGIKARVFLAGWVDWAMHPSLPVDSLTYPDKKTLQEKPDPEINSVNNLLILSAVITIGFALIGWSIYSKFAKQS